MSPAGGAFFHAERAASPLKRVLGTEIFFLIDLLILIGG